MAVLVGDGVLASLAVVVVALGAVAGGVGVGGQGAGAGGVEGAGGGGGEAGGVAGAGQVAEGVVGVAGAGFGAGAVGEVPAGEAVERVVAVGERFVAVGGGGVVLVAGVDQAVVVVGVGQVLDLASGAAGGGGFLEASGDGVIGAVLGHAGGAEGGAGQGEVGVAGCCVPQEGLAGLPGGGVGDVGEVAVVVVGVLQGHPLAARGVGIGDGGRAAQLVVAQGGGVGRVGGGVGQVGGGGPAQLVVVVGGGDVVGAGVRGGLADALAGGVPGVVAGAVGARGRVVVGPVRHPAEVVVAEGAGVPGSDVVHDLRQAGAVVAGGGGAAVGVAHLGRPAVDVVVGLGGVLAGVGDGDRQIERPVVGGGDRLAVGAAGYLVGDLDLVRAGVDVGDGGGRVARGVDGDGGERVGVGEGAVLAVREGDVAGAVQGVVAGGGGSRGGGDDGGPGLAVGPAQRVVAGGGDDVLAVEAGGGRGTGTSQLVGGDLAGGARTGRGGVGRARGGAGVGDGGGDRPVQVTVRILDLLVAQVHGGLPGGSGRPDAAEDVDRRAGVDPVDVLGGDGRPEGRLYRLLDRRPVGTQVLGPVGPHLGGVDLLVGLAWEDRGVGGVHGTVLHAVRGGDGHRGRRAGGGIDAGGGLHLLRSTRLGGHRLRAAQRVRAVLGGPGPGLAAARGDAGERRVLRDPGQPGTHPGRGQVVAGVGHRTRPPGHRAGLMRQVPVTVVGRGAGDRPERLRRLSAEDQVLGVPGPRQIGTEVDRDALLIPLLHRRRLGEHRECGPAVQRPHLLRADALRHPRRHTGLDLAHPDRHHRGHRSGAPAERVPGPQVQRPAPTVERAVVESGDTLRGPGRIPHPERSEPQETLPGVHHRIRVGVEHRRHRAGAGEPLLA